MCPPSSSPTRSGRSRLIRVPGRQLPSVVFDSVSAEASTANQSAPTSTAVRQQPAQAIEAPIGIGGIRPRVADDQPHVGADARSG